jgi:hypothetical protein
MTARPFTQWKKDKARALDFIKNQGIPNDLGSLKMEVLR